MIKQYFAELGTDRVIRESYFPDFSVSGTMIEVGGGTPEFLSMSRHFKLNGWRTIVVEPNPEFVKLHRKQGNNEVYEQPFGFYEAGDRANFGHGTFGDLHPSLPGNMMMVYVFEFVLQPFEIAIVTQSGVLPKPTGVRATASYLT